MVTAGMQGLADMLGGSHRFRYLSRPNVEVGNQSVGSGVALASIGSTYNPFDGMAMAFIAVKDDRYGRKNIEERRQA